MEFFDTHVHLDVKDYEADLEDVIKRAKDVGVTRFITIGAGEGFISAKKAISLAEKYPFIWASVGVHPHDAKSTANIDQIRELAKHPRVVAIGETGLDFFRDWAPREFQESWFRAQIELAKEVKKPLIIHSREAGADCFAILTDLNATSVGGVFHCYGENAEFAKKLRAINFLISIPGSVTFKKATLLRETVAAVPLTQIMLETDGPFLAPEPHRGKRCESSFMIETAKMVAQIKGVSIEEVAQITTNTALKFFKI